MFQINCDCFGQAFVYLGIYVSIQFQSDILRIVQLDVKAIWGQCFQMLIHLCVSMINNASFRFFLGC